MERIILIETSTALCSTALAENGEITSYRESSAPKAHASLTAVFIQEMLEERGLNLGDCDAICVSMGPGSYTGLRVGVSTAKGLGGGLPIGAVLMSEKVQNVLGPGDHGSTFGGNPIACAGALSILHRIDEPFLDEVNQKSAYVFSSLSGAPGIEAVSGLGLMIGIKTVKPAKEVVAECMNRGVLCLTAKDKVRLLPALNIPMELLQKAVAVIKEACK